MDTTEKPAENSTETPKEPVKERPKKGKGSGKPSSSTRFLLERFQEAVANPEDQTLLAQTTYQVAKEIVEATEKRPFRHKVPKKSLVEHGRATKTLALWNVICGRVADGEYLTDICSEPSMPTRQACHRWAIQDKEFAEMMNQALVLRADKFVEEITSLADQSIGCDPAKVQGYRLAVDARKWVAARLAPRRYGDRVTLSGDTDAPIAVSHVQSAELLVSKIRGLTHD